MTNQMTSDTSFWIKVLRDSDLSVDDDTLLQYTTILADRFTTVEEFLATDENELINLGITNHVDRVCLIKQAHLLDDKESFSLTRQSAMSNRTVENWLLNNQSTPVNPKSKRNLSPGLLSRISFNDHKPTNENKQYHFETPEKTPIVHNTQKIKSSQKQTPSTSNHALRTIKSLSDTIALQKKILVGTERLKRLTISGSVFKRQTALIGKKVSNITNKIINPFAKTKNKNVSILNDNDQIAMLDNSIKENLDQVPKERRTIKILNINNDLRRSTDLLYDQEKSKPIVQPVQTLATKRFKLGATTTFLTRSLANHGQMD